MLIFQSNAVENINDTIATSIRLEHPKSGDEGYLMDDCPKKHSLVRRLDHAQKLCTRFVRRFCLAPCTALHRAEFIYGQFAPMTVVHCTRMMRLYLYVYVIRR